MELENKAKYLVKEGRFESSQIYYCNKKYKDNISRWFDKYLKSKVCKRPK